MIETFLGERFHRAVLLLPVLTTLCSIVFCVQRFGRYRKLTGLMLIYAGHRFNISGRAPRSAKAAVSVPA